MGCCQSLDSSDLKPLLLFCCVAVCDMHSYPTTKSIVVEVLDKTLSFLRISTLNVSLVRCNIINNDVCPSLSTKVLFKLFFMRSQLLVVWGNHTIFNAQVGYKGLSGVILPFLLLKTYKKCIFASFIVLLGEHSCSSVGSSSDDFVL